MNVDPIQILEWVFVIVVWLLLPFLLVGRSRLRAAILRQLEPLRAWAARRARPEPDPAEADLRLLRRQDAAEQRAADLERLRHLMRTDTGMSATRQLANRLAYEQLCADLEQAVAAEHAVAEHAAVAERLGSAGRAAAPIGSPAAAFSGSATAEVVEGFPARSPVFSSTETVDLGWR